MHKIELRNRKAYTNGSFSTDLHAYKTHFLSSTNLKIYLVKQNDTAEINYNPDILSEDKLSFYVSSVPSPDSYDLYVSNSIDSIRLDISIPNDAVGVYDLVLSNSIDSIMMSFNFLKVYNPSLTQIADIIPDSIDNTYWLPQLITVYGNNTHFTSDTNVIYFTDLYEGIGWVDSLKVINDSLLTFTVLLPMPVKNAVEPNNILSIFNSVDGILRFPMEILIYGSIGDQNTVFSKIECYPNPANRFITISSEDFANEKSLSKEIFSIDGKKVSSELFQNSSSITLDIQNLAKGVYIAKVKGEEKISSFKFIVR